MTEAEAKSYRRQAVRLLQHAEQRSRWIDGVPGAAGRSLAALVRELGGPAGPIAVAMLIVVYFASVMMTIVIGQQIGLIALLTLPVLPLAYMASFLAYDEAERHSRNVYHEGVRMVQADVQKGTEGSLLFPTDEAMKAWSRLMETQDAATLRSVTMRLAALIALHRASADHDRRLETARAAETVLSSVSRQPPPAVPAPSKTDRRLMGRIVGDGRTVERTVRTGDAHADEIAFIVQEALADDPDLADSLGGRIDRLVDVDLPRLVAERDAALRHATEDGARRALADYAHGIATIERSVAEALDAWHAARADALATRVRFLSQRRGEEFRRAGAATDAPTEQAGDPSPHRGGGTLMSAIEKMLPRTRTRA